MWQPQDSSFMQQALQLAEQAAKRQEVPVGALLVLNDQVIGQGHNQPIGQHDPTAHAEIVALRQGAQHLKNYRLLGTTLYVTLEPCLMCVGAMVHARIERLVFGAYDPKAGAVASVMQALNLPMLNHRIQHAGGLHAEECGTLLSQFFAARR